MEREALAVLYAQCALGAWRHAASLVHDEAAAWDVVHEVFARLCRDACLPEAPVAYLHAAVAHASLNLLRARRARHPEGGAHAPNAPAEADEGPEPSAPSGEAALGAREILARLGGRLGALDHDILSLVIGEGLTQAEAARAMHISRRTLSRHLGHIQAEARHLAEEVPTPPAEPGRARLGRTPDPASDPQ